MINHITKQLNVGLIIFTKNEEKTIGLLIDKVCDLMDKKDIFVIDGHSMDDTGLIVRRKGVSLFSDSGQGKGSAIQLALGRIDKDILVFMDSDGSHSPDEIHLLLEPFLTYKDVAMVVGSRFKGGSEEFYSSFHEIVRFIGNVLSTFLVNLIWRARLSDVQSGFRAVKRDLIKELLLTEDSFAIEQEMVIKCLKKKKKIVEVPSWELKRRHNNSHIIPSKMLLWCASCFIKNIFK